MKALLLSQIFPSQSEPTRGTYNLNVFKAIASYGDVRVVSPRPWWNRLRHSRDLLRTPRLDMQGLDSTYPTYWSVPGAPRLHAKGMHVSLDRHIHALRREFPFDVVLAAWMYPDAVVAARIAERYNCPFVIKILGSDINFLPNVPGLKGQIVWALRRASRVITVSEALRQKVIDLGTSPERVVTQHNGVDGEKFAIRSKIDARTQLGLDPHQKHICYVGNLVIEKGPDLLIEAMAHLRSKDDVRLNMIGDGDMRAGLEKRASALNISHAVSFLGKLPHEQIPTWITASDLLCLSSRREGCPNVVLEALASGRPVVAARVGGVPEILPDGSGVLVEPENPESLAAGLANALEREWSPSELRSYVEFLSWQEVGYAYYRSLVEATGSMSQTASEAAQFAHPH